MAKSSKQQTVLDKETQKMALLGKQMPRIAHELNGLLTVICSNCDLVIMDDQLNKDRRKNLRIAISAAERAYRLLNSILCATSIAEEPYVNIAGQLPRIAEIFTNKSINLVFNLDNVNVPCSCNSLFIIFANLIKNAIESMPDGGTLQLTSISKNGIIILVEDEGHGIPPTLQNKVFNPHFTTKPSGHGIGLRTTKRIVENIGGKICFESAPGYGTIFKVSLPTAKNISV
jgi:two-component system sporulation sensor kinase A